MVDWRRKIVRVDFTIKLPDEILLHILLCPILSSQDLFKISRLNTKMNNLYQDESIWKKIIAKNTHTTYYFQPIHISNILDLKYFTYFKNKVQLPINKHTHFIPARDFSKYYNDIYLPASMIRLTNSEAFVCVILKKVNSVNTKLCLEVKKENTRQNHSNIYNYHRMLSEFYVDNKRRTPRREYVEGETEIGGFFFQKADVDAIIDIFNKIFI